ncbi:MAG: hypothetical protein Q8N88_02965 [Nanoarchaeota archaeon]|nr:hypothetical protein [Nanoarchaeota archaeon]
MKFSWIIILLFSFIGFFLTGNIIHELSHKIDFRKINKNSEQICFLEFSENSAKYSFSANPSEIKKISEINKYTEIKAYSLNFLLALIFLSALFFSLKNLKTEKYIK